MLLKILIFEWTAAFGRNKSFFSYKNREKCLVTRKIFSASKKSYVHNLVLLIAFRFQIDWIKIVRVLLLAELKNAVLRKTRLKFHSRPTCTLRRSTRKAVTWKIKYFYVPNHRYFIFEYLKYILSQRNRFFQNST